MRYAEIAYTAHARLRIDERSIPERVVVDVLADPDRSYLDHGELVAERVLADGKPWRVAYVEERRGRAVVARVVSVYRIRKLKQP